MSFLKNVLKETSNEYGTIAADGLATSDVAGYVDTGSFVFNALVSGSIHGGLPQNKITALAGESATGKTFFVLGVVKGSCDMNHSTRRQIDWFLKRVCWLPCVTVIRDA